MKFIEDGHKYVDEEGQYYLSVTTLLKSLQEKVNWDEVAEKKARKLGVEKDWLLGEWEKKRDTAALKGTNFHKMMEDKFRGVDGITIDEQRCDIEVIDTIEGIKIDLDEKLENNKVYAEKMIWSKSYKVCGTADYVEVMDNRISVKDWKTSERIDLESYKHPNPKIGRKMLLAPVKHLMDCNHILYSLQLNTYMFMLLQQNRHLKIGKMEILHILFDENNEYLSTVPYPAQNMQKEIKLILEKHRKG